MFNIKVNGILLDLDGTSVRFEIVNSIFEQSALQGDWSFPFPIKWSDRNGVAFGFANMLEVPNKEIYYQATCYFGTKSFVTGRLILNGGGNNYFNSSIAGGVKGLINADTSLKDLPFLNPVTGDGTINLPGTSFGPIVLPGLTSAALDFQTADYNNIIAFPPHSNPNFYGNANPDFQGIVNIVIAEDGTHPNNTVGAGGNKYCLVPFVYLFYVLETAFAQNGLVASGSFVEDEEMKKALIYNNHALDKQSMLGCIVKSAADEAIVISNSPGPGNQRVILLNNITGCEDEFSGWNNVLHEFVLKQDLQYDIRFTGMFYGSGTGYFTISLVLDPILGGGLSVVDSILVSVPLGGSQAVGLYAIVPGLHAGDKIYVLTSSGVGDPPTNVTLLAGAKLEVRAYTGQVFNGMTNIVTIKNHVPDMTLAELLNELKKFAQLDFTYDYINNKIVINYIETILRKPPGLDISTKLGKNYELLFDDKNKGYIVGYNFGSSDNLVKDNFKVYDSTRLVGSFNSLDDLPVPVSAGNFAIVKSTNKVMVSQETDFSFTWIEYTDNYYDIQTGNGETEVKTMLAPMLMMEAQNETNISPDPINTRSLIPSISEPGSSPIFDLGENPPSLRIVFMRGMNVSGGQYVCASSTNYDQLGVSNGNHTLKMNDSDGLFKKLHEKIINALTTADMVERELLADINLLTDPRLKGKVSAGNMFWILHSITASIGRTIKVSKSKWLKL